MNNLIKILQYFQISDTNKPRKNENIENEEVLFDDFHNIDTKNSKDTDYLYNNLIELNNTKIPPEDAGSLEYTANLMKVNVSEVSDVEYNKKGQVIRFKVNYNLSDDYEKGRVRTTGHQFAIRYYEDGHFVIKKTEILTADDNTLIGYPSMYYSYDVVKDCEYTFYFKRDQFQIPVGFEGYVRLPFSSYGIPDWCKTNAPLDLNSFTGSLFLSQDNRAYGGLSYLVINVGVYFNDTAAASMFNDSNTIKKNMGL